MESEALSWKNNTQMYKNQPQLHIQYITLSSATNFILYFYNGFCISWLAVGFVVVRWRSQVCDAVQCCIPAVKSLCAAHADLNFWDALRCWRWKCPKMSSLQGKAKANTIRLLQRYHRIIFLHSGHCFIEDNWPLTLRTTAAILQVIAQGTLTAERATCVHTHWPLGAWTIHTLIHIYRKTQPKSIIVHFCHKPSWKQALLDTYVINYGHIMCYLQSCFKKWKYWHRNRKQYIM